MRLFCAEITHCAHDAHTACMPCEALPCLYSQFPYADLENSQVKNFCLLPPPSLKQGKALNALIQLSVLHMQCVLTCSTKAATKKHLSPMMGSDMNNARPNKVTFFFQPSGLVADTPAPSTKVIHNWFLLIACFLSLKIHRRLH